MKRQTPEDAIGRQPPYDTEAEMAVLGAMLLGDKNANETAFALLNRADFYRDAHAYIWDAMAHLQRLSEPIDIITLRNTMTAQGTLEGIGVEYLLALSNVEFTTSNVKYYASIVKEKKLKRQIIEVGARMNEIAYRDDDTNAEDIIMKAERELEQIQTTRGASVTLYDAMEETLDGIRQDIEEGKKPGIMTGFTRLDNMIGGFQPGNLIVLAARPKMGKTSMFMDWCNHMAQLPDAPVCAVFSLEMDRRELALRQYASMTNIHGSLLRQNDLTKPELYAMEKALRRARNMRIHIVDQARITSAQIRSECRNIKMQEGRIDCIFVDYLTLMDSPENLARARDERLVTMQNCRDMKKLAREFKVPVILLSQVSRGVEQRADKRPMMSDLAESGTIEADANMVVFLYRPEYYNASADPSRTFEEAEIIIAANRSGPTGIVKVGFHPPLTKFVEIDENREYPAQSPNQAHQEPYSYARDSEMEEGII